MSKKKINIAVIGATGYTGLDLVFLLSKHPNANIIINSCNKYKFETFQVERYVKKLLLGREELKDRCITANIVVSNEILDNKIILAFGNPLWAFNSVRQDHLCSQEHQ